MRMQLITVLLALFCSVSTAGTHNGNTWFTDASEMRESDWSNPAELEKMWQASWINLPVGKGESETFTVASFAQSGKAPMDKLPTVIFLHGCAGQLAGEERRIQFFAQNGFAVISPNSLERSKYPKSCRIFPKKAFMYRGHLALRQYDVSHAIKEAKKLDWVDQNNVFLFGHSEGAILAATFDDPKATVNARIVESWTCHATWPEYKGVNAPVSEPVLSLLSAGDPWFVKGEMAGTCVPFLHTDNGSLSRVYPKSVTKGKHKVMDFEPVKKDVLAFIKAHSR